MERCETCRFFAQAERGVDLYDQDECEMLETGHHSCLRILHGNSGDVPFGKAKEEPALVTDGSGYAARLCVLPTFGCVLHEPKGPP